MKKTERTINKLNLSQFLIKLLVYAVIFFSVAVLFGLTIAIIISIIFAGFDNYFSYFFNNLYKLCPIIVIWIIPSFYLMIRTLRFDLNKNRRVNETRQENTTSDKLINTNGELKNFYQNYNYSSSFYIKKIINQYNMKQLFRGYIIIIYLILFLLLIFNFIFLIGSNFEIKKYLSMLNTPTSLIIMIVFCILFPLSVTILYTPFIIFYKLNVPNAYKEMFFLLSVLDLDQLNKRIYAFENSHVMRNPDVDKTLLWYFKGITFIYHHDYQNALDFLDRVLKIIDESYLLHFDVLLLVGDCYNNLGEKLKAKNYYELSLKGFFKFNIDLPQNFLRERIN